MRKYPLKSNFHKNKNMRDGLNTHCKNCIIQKQKQYDIENRVKKREYYQNNRDRIKDYYLQNRDRIKHYQLKNHDKIIAQKKIYSNNKYKSDINFRLVCNLRKRVLNAFKARNVRKTNKTFSLLGCSHSFLRLWIESQLYSEMTLENYGKIWCLDHCLPIASFNLLDGNDVKKCFNWINLRPMYVKDIIIKGDKIDYHLYLLQELKAKYFLKLNNDQQGLN